MFELGIDVIKAIYNAVLRPIFKCFGTEWQIVRQERRKRAELIRWLKGMPYEAKAMLVEFYVQDTHTCRLNPCDPMVDMAVRQNLLVLGPGGGTYDAIDRYMTIRPEVWAIFSRWVAGDRFAKRLSKQRSRQILKELMAQDQADSAGDKPQ